MINRLIHNLVICLCEIFFFTCYKQIAKCGKARLSCVKAPKYGCELSNQIFVYDSVKQELILGQEKAFFFFLMNLDASQTAFN